MAKRRIVILSAFLSPYRSGAEAMVEEVTKHLKDDYDFIIVTSRLKRSLPKRGMLHNNIKIIRIGCGCVFDKWLFPFLAPLKVCRLRPDLIHAVLESYAAFALIFCKWTCPRTKRLLTLQSTNTDFLLGPIHRSPDALTGISSTLLNRAKKWKRDDVMCIPNGIDLPAIEKAMASEKRVPGRILFVGRLRSMKGVDTLLRTFALLKDCPASLRIVGDGPDRIALERLALELGIAERTEFTGYIGVPDVYKEFAQAEIFCGLSRHEAFGNVFAEAQAAGCAVVGTNVEGIPEVVKNGETGTLVPPDDPKAAADAINSLFAHAERKEQMIAHAKERVRMFDWQQISKRYAEMYERLFS